MNTVRVNCGHDNYPLCHKAVTNKSNKQSKCYFLTVLHRNKVELKKVFSIFL